MDKKYWEASLTGDLVCGYCGKVTVIHTGYLKTTRVVTCSWCKGTPELTQGVVELAERRAEAAYPGGRPPEDGPKWKGDNLYDG